MKKQAVFLIVLVCAAAFAQTPPDPAAQEDTEEFRSLLLRVNFEPNSTTLTPPSAAALDSMAARFKQDARRRYEVHGHSCPDAGDKSSAMRFSIQRVETIVNFLMKSGVPTANIVTIINPAPENVAAGECTHDRRVDIMTMETRKIERKPDPVVTKPVPKPESVDDPDPIPTHDEKRSVGAATSRPPLTPIDPATTTPDGKPTLAIYMAGDEPQNVRGVHNILGGELARTISESEKYLAVDRTSDILKQIEKEHIYQRGGAVDDDQIKELGKQLGANYLCISNINPVKKSYYLDVRLVDVTTAEIIRTVTANSSLKDANEMTRVARNVAFELIETEKAREQRLRRKKILRWTSISLDIVGAGAIAYGAFVENENVIKFNDEYAKEPESERAAMRRNIAYIAGGALLAGGVTIHIFF